MTTKMKINKLIGVTPKSEREELILRLDDLIEIRSLLIPHYHYNPDRRIHFETVYICLKQLLKNPKTKFSSQMNIILDYFDQSEPKLVNAVCKVLIKIEELES